MSLPDRIAERAQKIGLDFIGIAPAGTSPRSASYRRWLEQGYAAGMSWLGRDADRRADPRKVLAGARSVVVVGLSYFVQNPPPEIWNDPSRGRIARYAWGADYHDELLPRVKELAEFIRAEIGRSAHFGTYVDTGPVLEREWAERAGLGFIGKNTQFIHPQLGSYVFLGEILTDVELEECRMPNAECRMEETREAGQTLGTRKSEIGTFSCGRCRRCLNVCPTQAFAGPYVLDSRRCISYLTIENKGAIPEDLRRSMENWIFGCDECQQVCPWVQRSIRCAKVGEEIPRPGKSGARNDKETTQRLSSRAPTSERVGARDLRHFLRFDPEQCAPRLVELIGLDEKGFRDRFGGTPVMRAKRRGLLRNAAVALGNSKNPAALPALEKALRDKDPLVREHVQWAIGQIQGRE